MIFAIFSHLGHLSGPSWAQFQNFATCVKAPSVFINYGQKKTNEPILRIVRCWQTEWLTDWQKQFYRTLELFKFGSTDLSGFFCMKLVKSISQSVFLLKKSWVSIVTLWIFFCMKVGGLRGKKWRNQIFRENSYLAVFGPKGPKTVPTLGDLEIFEKKSNKIFRIFFWLLFDSDTKFFAKTYFLDS